MRRDSWYSVRMTCSPPLSATPGPRRMSVPRPTHDIEAVHRSDFARDFSRGTRHPGQPQVAPEEALVGQAGERFAPLGGRAALLYLDQLVQPVLPRAIGHHAAGGLV